MKEYDCIKKKSLMLSIEEAKKIIEKKEGKPFRPEHKAIEPKKLKVGSATNNSQMNKKVLEKNNSNENRASGKIYIIIS